MIRLLVIDADAQFLADLEQRLAPQRSVWEMSFATPADAAAHLGDGSWDVVVADLTLRIGDAGVLDAAKRAQPAAVRIALAPAGNAVPDLTAAHQLLPRGCDAAILRSTVLRSVELRGRLTDPRVLELLGSLPSLPSPSTAMVELRQALDAADVDLRRVGRTVASDIAMGTKLLQVVNSSYYSLSRTVEDPAEGVRLLGARLTGELLLTVGLLDAVATRGSGVDAQLTAMRERSIARADLAATLAERAGRAPLLVRRVWNGAFLLDIGEMLLVGTQHEADPDLVALRATIGGALLEMWGLPHHLVEVVALSDLAPERSTPEAVHYAWLAAEFSARRDAVAADADGPTTESVQAGPHPADPELVSSVLRWAGLASIDLSDLVPQPTAVA
jgi:HD-like signal output (HDOD) protein